MENIEHVFYINLDKRTDRKELIEKELENYDIKAERFSGIYYSPPKGIVGCTKSHLQVIKLAKERKYKNVLIFEDDFCFLKSKSEIEENIKKLFQSKPDFDVCFLSYNLHEGIVDSDYPFLTKVISSATASCYIINSHYYDKLIALYEHAAPLLDKTMEHWKYANDQIWKILQRQDNWYCFTTRLGKQRDGFSDNANKSIAYNC